MAALRPHACKDHAAQAFALLMEGDPGRGADPGNAGPLPGDSLTIDSRAGCYLCEETTTPADAVLALDWALSILKARRETARVAAEAAKRAAEAAGGADA